MIYLVLKEKKKNKPVNLAKLSFKNKGEIKAFPDKRKLREFITNKYTVKEMVKGVF